MITIAINCRVILSLISLFEYFLLKSPPLNIAYRPVPTTAKTASRHIGINK